MSSGKTFEEYLGAAASSDVNVDYGDSELFSKDELKEAAVQVKCKFASFPGCELHSLRYVGDESNSKEQLERAKTLTENNDITQVIEFLTDFHTSPEENENSVFEADKEIKDYHWLLARTDDDGWQVIDQGF